jgi:hypothetical protein
LTGSNQEIAGEGRFRLNEPSVVADVIDGETIIMNLESGDYYSLNPSGGELWQLLLSGLGREALSAAIAGRHGLMPPRPEIERFVDRLIEFRLLVPREQADGPVDFTLQGAPAPWRAPEIAVYGDMRELLAMDPPLPLAKPARS